MADFESRLQRILDDELIINEMAPPPEDPSGSGIDRNQFLQFLNAIVTGSDEVRAKQAMERVLTMEPARIAEIISEVQPLGSLVGLSNYIKNKPSNIMMFIDIARMLFSGNELEEVVNAMIQPEPEGEQYYPDGDYYYEQGNDDGGH